MADLLSLFNRGYSKSHLFGVRGEALLSKDRPNHRGTPLGVVLNVNRDKIKLRLSVPLNQGDGIKFERGDDGFICNKIYKNGLLTATAKAGDVIELDAKAKTMAGDSVVKTGDAALLKALQAAQTRRVPVTGALTAKVGQPVRFVLSDANGHKAAAQGQPVQASRTAPTTHDDILGSFSKLGDTPFQLVELDIDAEDNIFIAKSALNALRRDAADALTQMRAAVPSVRINNAPMSVVRYEEEDIEPKLHVLVRNAAQFGAVKDIVTGDIYTDDEKLYFENKAAYPRLRLKTDRLSQNPEPFKEECLLVADHGGLYTYPPDNDIVLDHSVYALNASSLSVFVSQGAKRVALAPELALAHAEDMLTAYKACNGQTAPVEAILRARYELMAMKHCVLSGALGQSACGLCKKKRFFLEDLKGSRYPVMMDKHCQSHVLHSRVTEANVSEYLALGVKHFRIELFDEDADQSAQIVQRCLDELFQKGKR